ncbi:DNA-binding response regulator [Saccharothrix sp. ALI-22-I]|uniref:response regulator n=1 Tax=Saccharothrix sp. ALI-22-I TaxID=1933778 RepID=UPI00097C77BC|nr:response regulator transcription factor [Saccharothrix sp. ALI-22-I]ONI84690.1 DNA-binding response regulator [Saccharothrix sp. ALI-22-I]
MTAAVRVLIVDDQALFREALATLLEVQPEIEVVGEAGDGEQAVRLCAELRPDVVLMDLRMPVMDGIAATNRLRVEQPGVRVLALTTFDDDADVFAALRAGVLGYLLKDVSSAQLVEALVAARRGESVLQPSVATKLVARVAQLPHEGAPARVPLAVPLSERELDVVRLLAEGRSNREIAGRLFLAEGTVKNLVTSVLSKLQVRDRTQAALRARELGLC